jgi:predicted nucleic acid-binding protein
MILADTSVWVDHLQRRNAELAALLVDEHVLCHPFVVGELACGRLRNRREILALLHALPQAHTVEHDEALEFIEIHQLMGTGLGWVDVHLLAAAALVRAKLWTFDRRLMNAAKRLGTA